MSELREPMVKLGVVSINSLQYGNPRLEQHFKMLEGSSLDVYIDELKELFPPANNSDQTKQELKLVKDKMKSLSNSSLRDEYIQIDRDLRTYIGYVGSRLGHQEVVGFYDQISLLADSTIYKLKYFFQRPRPYQLASIFDMELYPIESCSSLSPSFPSRSTIKAYLCQLFLQSKGAENSLAETVARSRTALGLHYPSDHQGAFEIVDKLIEKPEIKSLLNGKSITAG